MKNKRLIICIFGILSFCSVLGFAFTKRYIEASNNIDLRIESSNKVYQLGEIAGIEIKLTNNTTKAIYIEGNPYIKIAFKEDKNYKFYAPPPSESSFVVDGNNLNEIKPGETINYQRTILWNYKPETKGLSNTAVERVNESKILTNYAFPEAGIYFIKVCISLPNGEKLETLESEPTKITITESQGEDLEVWNKIKDDGDFAYFIQKSDFRIPRYKTEERAKFQQKIERILIEHPNSFYFKFLEQSLTKFKANEAKLQKTVEKLKVRKP